MKILSHYPAILVLNNFTILRKLFPLKFSLVPLEEQFWFYIDQKELKLSIKPLQVIHFNLWPSDPDAKYQLAQFRYAQFWGFKVTQQSSLLLFAFSPPLFFRFSCLIFFLCWAFSRLHFHGESFQESLQDLIDKRRGRWVQWNKIFMEIFKSMLHSFLPFSRVSLTELCSFQCGL